MARSVRLALGGELVPDAVNVSGGVIAEEVRPGIALAEKLGRIFTALAGAVPAQLDVEVQGEITQYDVSVWKLAALKGLFTGRRRGAGVLRQRAAARRRSAAARSACSPTPISPDYRNVITLRGTLADGTVVSVAGTLTGPRMIEKIVGVNGFDLEVPISEHMAFFRYDDRPGVVGTVGRLLGEADINIAGMQVARDRAGRPGARRAHRRHAPSRPTCSPTSPPRSAPRRPGVDLEEA